MTTDVKPLFTMPGRPTPEPGEWESVAGDLCQAGVRGVCTRGAQHTHHRKSRARGGRNNPENLLRVCFACHDWIHAHPGKAHERGFLVHSWEAV